jgi:hypothetical protein
MPKLDRLIGIVLGVVLGAAIVTAFVFWGSEDTIDKAAIGDGGRNGGAVHQAPRVPPVETVTIIGGMPPTDTGAPTFDYRTGDRVRLSIESDATVVVEVFGYGIDRTVPAGEPTLVEFKAAKPGNFPVIVPASHIGVANVRVGAGGSP